MDAASAAIFSVLNEDAFDHTLLGPASRAVAVLASKDPDCAVSVLVSALEQAGRPWELGYSQRVNERFSGLLTWVVCAGSDPEVVLREIAANFPADKKCRAVWTDDHVAYRCKDCGLSDSSCMCVDCFDPSQHIGHDYRLYRSQSGGCCDCGDPLAWRPEGFCSKHRRAATSEASSNELDPKVLLGATVAARACVRRIVWSLRRVFWKDAHPAPLSEEHPVRQALLQAVAWMQQFADVCNVFRKVLCEALLEPLPTLSVELPQPLTSDGRRLCDGDSEISNISTSGVLKWSVQTAGDSIRDRTTVDSMLRVGVYLDEALQDAVGVLYLRLLFYSTFKEAYTRAFVVHYPGLLDLFMSNTSETLTANIARFLDRILCQLFHNEEQVLQLVKEREGELLYAMVDRFEKMLLSAKKITVGVPLPAHPVAVSLPHSTCSIDDDDRGLYFTRRGEKAWIASDGGIGAVKPIITVDCESKVVSGTVYCRVAADLRTMLAHMSVSRYALLECGIGRPAKSAEVSKKTASKQSGDLRNPIAAVPSSSASSPTRTSGISLVFEVVLRVAAQAQGMNSEKCKRNGGHVLFEAQAWQHAFVLEHELAILLNTFIAPLKAEGATVPLWGGRKAVPAVDMMDEGCKGDSRTPDHDTIGSDQFRLQITKRRCARANTIIAVLQSVTNALVSWLERTGLDSKRFISLDERYPDLTLAEKIVHKLADGKTETSFHLPLTRLWATLCFELVLIRNSIVQEDEREDWFPLTLAGYSPWCTGPFPELVYHGLNTLIVEHPLRVLVLTDQIEAGIWVRNGLSMQHQLLYYRSKFWHSTGQDLDVFVMQLAAACYEHGGEALVHQARRRYGLQAFFSLGGAGLRKVQQETGFSGMQFEPEYVSPQHFLLMAEGMLRCLFVIVNDRTRSGRTTRASLRHEIIHWLAVGKCSFSTIESKLSARLTAHDDAETVLREVGKYHEPSSVGVAGNDNDAFGDSGGGFFTLRPECWSEVEPHFLHWSRREEQQAEEAYRTHCNVLRKRATTIKAETNETEIYDLFPVRSPLRTPPYRPLRRLPRAILWSHELALISFGILHTAVCSCANQNDEMESSGVKGKAGESKKTIEAQRAISERLLAEMLQLIIQGLLLLDEEQTRYTSNQNCDILKKQAAEPLNRLFWASNGAIINRLDGLNFSFQQAKLAVSGDGKALGQRASTEENETINSVICEVHPFISLATRVALPNDSFPLYLTHRKEEDEIRSGSSVRKCFDVPGDRLLAAAAVIGPSAEQPVPFVAASSLSFLLELENPCYLQWAAVRPRITKAIDLLVRLAPKSPDSNVRDVVELARNVATTHMNTQQHLVDSSTATQINDNASSSAIEHLSASCSPSLPDSTKTEKSKTSTRVPSSAKLRAKERQARILASFAKRQAAFSSFMDVSSSDEEEEKKSSNDSGAENVRSPFMQSSQSSSSAKRKENRGDASFGKVIGGATSELRPQQASVMKEGGVIVAGNERATRVTTRAAAVRGLARAPLDVALLSEESNDSGHASNEMNAEKWLHSWNFDESVLIGEDEIEIECALCRCGDSVLQACDMSDTSRRSAKSRSSRNEGGRSNRAATGPRGMLGLVAWRGWSRDSTIESHRYIHKSLRCRPMRTF